MALVQMRETTNQGGRNKGEDELLDHSDCMDKEARDWASG